MDDRYGDPKAVAAHRFFAARRHHGMSPPTGRPMAHDIYKLGLVPGDTIPGTSSLVFMCRYCNEIFGQHRSQWGHRATCGVCKAEKDAERAARMERSAFTEKGFCSRRIATILFSTLLLLGFCGCAAIGNTGVDTSSTPEITGDDNIVETTVADLSSERHIGVTTIKGDDATVVNFSFAGWGSAGVLGALAFGLGRRGLTHKHTAMTLVRSIEWNIGTEDIKDNFRTAGALMHFSTPFLRPRYVKSVFHNVAAIVTALGFRKHGKK